MTHSLICAKHHRRRASTCHWQDEAAFAFAVPSVKGGVYGENLFYRIDSAIGFVSSAFGLKWCTLCHTNQAASILCTVVYRFSDHEYPQSANGLWCSSGLLLLRLINATSKLLGSSAQARRENEVLCFYLCVCVFD